MSTTTPPKIIDPNPDRPHSIAENYVGNAGLRDEMVGADGALREHWQLGISMLDELGLTDLDRRWAHARRIIHENGVTHNVYGDPNGLDRPWNLDLIPLLIPSDEWQAVREGLIQRAHLLDRLLADIYGPMDTIRNGLLPPELVWANVGFLRACHGAMVPENRWLHLYAADLVRTPDGGFAVLSDRTQAPSGAGYALENRIALSRSLPAIFRQCNVQRLAPFFAELRQTLSSLAPDGRENPRIVLLTPGPYNETYFEHSYLAQYLGYSLVQGNDLTVRDATVYLRTVGGLQRVDVILRRVDDDYCDPLELLEGSYLGVPGLLQSVRAGNVTVANALGAGMLQAPGFLPFLPGICRQLLGEELKLPSVSTWWCGQPKELNFVLEHLREMVIKSAYPTRGADPVFGQELTREKLSDLAAAIKARPERYVAQDSVMSCTTPALVENHLQPRRFVVRAYLAASHDSYSVMDGALTRITPSIESSVVSLQHGGGSKDTWILSDGPVSQMTLLPAGVQPIPFSRGAGDLPSRIADDLFWLGRYVERAEMQVRLARAAYRRLIEESGFEDVRAAETLAASQRGAKSDEEEEAAEESPEEFVNYAVEDKEGGGISETVSQIQSIARVLRDRLPADCWRILQECYLRVSQEHDSAEEPSIYWMHLLQDLLTALAAFSGLAADSMMHSQSWRFLDMGRRIERAISTARLLSDTIVNPGNDPALLEAILEITESSFPYRRKYLTRFENRAVADLVLAEASNPRSVAFQLDSIARHLTALPRDPHHPDGDRDRQILQTLRDSIQNANLAELCEVLPDQPHEGLAEFLSKILAQMMQLSDAVAHVYFSHATVSRALAQEERNA
jgi:uncharacterized circularly permuted ATP-grasp superfamily protein/uncharacterized alpha-E superfamily protein